VDNSRLAALKILNNYKPRSTNLSSLINETLEKYSDMNDKGFARSLAWGTIRYLNTLDYVIDLFLKKPSATSLKVRNVLRLGIYQLLYKEENIPSYAVVNESVEMAKTTGNEHSKGLVNAVLREVLRRKGTLKYPDQKDNVVKSISIEYSHPQWLVSRWINRFGKERAINICKANNITPELCIRVNTLKISREGLKEALNKEGVPSLETRYSPDGLILSCNPEIKKLDAYKNKLFMVQDEASQAVCRVLAPEENETILDVCCGSGAKTTHIAQISENKAKIISVDNSQNQLDKLAKNLKMFGVENARIVNDDAKNIKNLKADRILFDSPCSGVGVIRRKPDIKWNRNEADITEKYPKFQKEILFSLPRLLRPGGVLVYSTCSIEPEENDNVINAFLDEFKDFTLVDSGFPKIFYPDEHGTDGFYIAKLKKAE
jgi:16S rRNA (cytosine967-C5)-methyltransferase